VVKKRTPARKSFSSKKRVKNAKAARPVRKAAAARGGVDFNPVKKQLRAHIAKLEKQLGGPEARTAAVDLKGWDTLDQLKTLNQQLTDLCQPTMVIPNS
jgi:uncharacterized protein (DUF1501 family)